MRRDLLEHEGHRVDVAPDGPTGLAHAESNRFDIALIDIGLPIMDGYEVARRLRQAPTPGELTLPERSALSRLDRGGPATSAELARAEQITPQAMATTLSGLEQRGLVRRQNDPHDGRRIIMSLTESGQSTHFSCTSRHFRPRCAATAATWRVWLDW